MLYWILLLFLVVFFGITRYRLRMNDEMNVSFSGKTVYIITSSVILIALASLRSIKVGADTGMYEQLFLYIQQMDTYVKAANSWQRGGVETGFLVLEYLVGRHLDFQFFLMITAIIAIVPTMLVIYKYSTNYLMSIFLLIAFGYFSFFMNGVRQSIAIGICMIAFIFAREKKKYQFFLCIFLAIMFHTSAIVFLPTYWLLKIKMNTRVFGGYLATLFIFFVLKDRIFLFINLFSRQQYEITGDAGGFRMYLFMMLLVVLMWIYRKRFMYSENLESKKNGQYYNMFIVSTLIWPIASANAAVFRMYYYYHIFMILCIPAFISTLRNRLERYIYSGFVVLIGCYYLHSYIINGALKYSPYYFFWE